MREFRFTLQVKIVLGSLLLALLLSIAICAVSYINYRSSLIERYTTVASESAELARSFTDGDKVAGYLDTLHKDDAYYEMQTHFNKIKDAFGLKFLYMHIPDGDSMNYIVDAQVEGDDPDTISDLGGSDVLWDGSRDIVMNAYRNGPEEGVIFITNEDYGYMATALLPVYDSGGKITALIGADISMDLVLTQLNRYILRITILTLAIVFGFVLLALWVVRGSMIRPLHLLAKAAGSFADGGLSLNFERVQIRSRDELHTLAAAYNKMAEDIILHVANVKRITAEKERIGAELSVATQIQASMLPCIFPPYPNRSEFDIYASMLPAKEVGGDFYDFFLVDDDRLCVVIADVSGKGVPAALFMVIAKTLIKNSAQAGKSPAEVFETVNNQLCEGNEAGMFVTAFMGILQISTGKFTYVNAGHNTPLVKIGEDDYDWLPTKPGFVLAGMEDIRFKQNEITLLDGDVLYLYTDGVTEAVNPRLELFSDPRLLQTANQYKDCSLKDMLTGIKNEIDMFADGADQADDITMLALKITGGSKMKELLIDATPENLNAVLDFISGELEAGGCGMKTQTQISIAAEEIFVNIAHYSYSPGIGGATIRVSVGSDVVIEFEDKGTPYNPLLKEDPDITMTAEEREIGGLGIFMVKQIMDSVEYKHEAGKNILTIRKSLFA